MSDWLGRVQCAYCDERATQVVRSGYVRHEPPHEFPSQFEFPKGAVFAAAMLAVCGEHQDEGTNDLCHAYGMAMNTDLEVPWPGKSTPD
ncbi:MAG: hypothetical protein ACRDTJ_04060 [Pseudonocardiaceae bacterium]